MITLIVIFTDQVGYIPAAYVEIVDDAYGPGTEAPPPPPPQDDYSAVDNDPSLPPPPPLDDNEDHTQRTQIVNSYEKSSEYYD